MNKDEYLNFRSEFVLHPTLNELNSIIKKNSEISFDYYKKTRIEFKLTCTKDIFWLDRSYALGQLDMDIEINKIGMFDADKLLKSCDNLLEKFMGIIGK